ncbi:MAG: hypothetical protein IT299_09815 [Dehalococcoidia bacterium]|nr:hypothetical protein [Dehalococcoidia bacterium]
MIVVGAYVFATGDAAPALSVGTRGQASFGEAAAPEAAAADAAPAPIVAPEVVRSQPSAAPPPAFSIALPEGSSVAPVAAPAARANGSAGGTAAAEGTDDATVLGAAVTPSSPTTPPTPPAPAALVEATPAPVSPPAAPAVVATAVPAAASTPTPPAAASALSVAAPPAAAPVLTDRERGLLEAMNARRAAAGLATLEPVSALTSASRSRSSDMLANNYFAHTSPTGQTWYSLLSSAGVGYSAGGENLAKVSGSVTVAVTQAIEALMASPTHRANILNPAFRKVGVGAAGQADQVTIFTSIFTDR